MRTNLSDDEFIELWNVHKSATRLAIAIGITERKVHARRRAIESRHNILLLADDKRVNPLNKPPQNHSARYSLGIENGTVIVFSDARVVLGGLSAVASGALNAFADGERVFLGSAAGVFAKFADIPSGKWAVPVGFRKDASTLFVHLMPAAQKA